jgi:predicted acylesterase/phospholipase RssA
MSRAQDHRGVARGLSSRTAFAAGLRQRLSRALAAVVLAVLVAGCAADLVPRAAVPAGLVEQAAVSDMQHVRFWGDSKPGAYKDLTQKRIDAVRKAYGPNASKISRTGNILTLSGGGSDGAYGAGLLVGWTEHGDRPQFDFVTGISTGAMMAPLAFLGSKYDAQLKESYTTLSTEDVATPQVFAAVIGAADSLADTKPLQGLVAKYMTAEMMKEIAAEHHKGRVLMIGTTNLDAQRSVIWDIGAISASGHPGSLALIRKIILASAAIPGAFPPVDISVTADGKQFQEMHVDGGVTRQVFLYPPGFSPKDVDKAIGWKMKRRLFIVRNTKIDPEFAVTKDQLIPIASRSISTLIKTQGIGDLYQIYSTAKRDGVDYNLAYIPQDFDVVSTSGFDKAYMNALYQRGYEMGRAGYAWHKYPPGLDPKQD